MVGFIVPQLYGHVIILQTIWGTDLYSLKPLVVVYQAKVREINVSRVQEIKNGQYPSPIICCQLIDWFLSLDSKGKRDDVDQTMIL